MGQYYRPTLIDERGNLSWLLCYNYGNGAKLMEHSYIGNNFVNAVLSMIYRNPMKVAWIGDYSDSPFEDAYSKKIDEEKFQIIYSSVWQDESDSRCIRPEITHKLTCRMKKRYLVNHTQRLYVDFGRYTPENCWKESYKWQGKKHNSTWCLNPLPLLTACGNDRGGGDFRSGNIRDCLYSDCDYLHWYVDRYGDMRCTAHHHDGTNRYLYREVKPGITETQLGNLCEKIYQGTFTRKDISRYTRKLGPYIQKIYGW